MIEVLRFLNSRNSFRKNHELSMVRDNFVNIC